MTDEQRSGSQAVARALTALRCFELARVALGNSELDATRARGWALDDQESHDGVGSLAAPVLGTHGTAIAAVAVLVPASRLGDRRLRALHVDLVSTAAAIEPALVGL